MRFQHCFEWLPIGRAMAGSVTAVGANEASLVRRNAKSLPTIHEVKILWAFVESFWNRVRNPHVEVFLLLDGRWWFLKLGFMSHVAMEVVLKRSHWVLTSFLEIWVGIWDAERSCFWLQKMPSQVFSPKVCKQTSAKCVNQGSGWIFVGPHTAASLPKTVENEFIGGILLVSMNYIGETGWWHGFDFKLIPYKIALSQGRTTRYQQKHMRIMRFFPQASWVIYKRTIEEWYAASSQFYVLWVICQKWTMINLHMFEKGSPNKKKRAAGVHLPGI